MTNLTRRHLLQGAAAGLLLPNMAFAAEEQVVVGTWGGDFGNILRAGVDEPLITPMGMTVVQDVGAPMQRRTKLLAERNARRGSMDVACLADFDIYAAQQMGVLEEITTANVPRTAQVLPFLKKTHSIPHIYSAHVIVYNTEKIKTPPAAFADLWDPKYRGKVGLTDFLFTTNTTIAAIVGGGSPTNFEPAAGKLAELRDLDVKILPSTESLATALKSGDIWITVIAAARAFMWNQAGLPVAHAFPSEGGFPTLYEAAVPKNARNKDAGLKYVNAMLEPQAQLAFAQRMGYLPTVKDAKLPDDLNRAIAFTEKQQENLLQLDYGYLQANQAQMLEMWNKTFKA
ncbi:extracellular solute-binding protein [Alcaligenaceae bacterium A4P071]|nr:extracellular solute-binding protein [Alcaligenaceae bacterium C4P045]MDQ2187554.1 extracellular solute-binding protein [Alcaligenaceae bacterium A4P071]